ncbi:MFS transporter [Acidobacterium sp. S8]|uniref:MFS transporter n=1 Tax=Acidobacterium sp. S8 TaxID=1641854 RepID=UPI00131C7C7B|nr:MFS transporter [Acidobacterium sp. S8]
MPLPPVPNPPPVTAPEPAKSVTGFEPLQSPLFRKLWIASTISNLGGWMQDTAGTWLMTVLTSSPLLIALMQTAASLPVVVLGLLAGATADIFDRRRLLIFWQAWMLTAVALLSLLTFFNVISPWVLLILTFLLNIGTAMNSPAWQAIMPELVPREQLPEAVSLNSAGFNLARALGPALGGLGVAAFTRADTGAASVFLLNSLSFVGVILVLYQWKRNPLFKSALPAERIFGSMRAGLRYIQYTPSLKATLARAFIFTIFVSAVWSLLAVVAARVLHQGALGYGILNGSMGLGAVIGATSLPRVRRKFSADMIITMSTGVFIGTLLVLAFVHYALIIIAMLLFAGFAWTSTMSTLNLAVQVLAPNWVQARALGIYQMVFSSGMAIGSVIWGMIAEHISTPVSLTSAAIGLLVTIPIGSRLHVLRGEQPDLTPFRSKFLPPQLSIEPEMTDGPVRVLIDYLVDPKDYNAFVHAIHELKDIRLRDGAIRWGIFQDADNPRHLNETFVMESWIDYLRQRERFTASDRTIRDRVVSFHRGENPPRITHTLYAKERAEFKSDNSS